MREVRAGEVVTQFPFRREDLTTDVRGRSLTVASFLTIVVLNS
jgi:hypothetical protein